MKYYYLNCEPSKRNVIKKHLQKRFESPYLIVDRLDSNDNLFQVTTKLTGYTELYETPKTIITDMEGVQLKTDPCEVSSEFIDVLEDTVTEVERLITYRNGSITLKGGGKI